ncbi:gag-pol polyprotein [Lasius niger]|uniref:Gag-pol polyprotein n=1 Tax=Lasius niger TaxID=67767 RepID=A0A0J7KS41_LASNI|nr:gag-pol polyprotein [Lasius niger]
MTRVENSIGRINIEISSKAASLLEMDDELAGVAKPAVLGEGYPEEETNQTLYMTWNTKRTMIYYRRRGHLGAPVVGVCSTVPGAHMSSSCVGPAPSLTTGEEFKAATVDSENEIESKDPLDLIFVDCASAVEDEPQQQASKIEKAPRSAAVMITGKEEGFSYAEALKKARGAISLDKLEIERTKIRRAANGGLLIEVMGPGGAGKALALKDKLYEVFHDQANVTRPVKGEIRLVGMDCTVSSEEVVEVISEYGRCLKEDVRVGIIRPMSNGLYTVWAQCPLSAAIRTVNNGKIPIGWTLARVDLLNRRPTQCFKCWKFGHLSNACKSTEDFSKLCFRCGGEDHVARSCRSQPSCKICTMEGRAADHRLGSGLCSAMKEVDRPQGNSIVDITWISPDLIALVKDWRVLSDVESLSDHLYISFVVSTSWSRPPQIQLSRKWNMRKFYTDLFRAALIWQGQIPMVEDRANAAQAMTWLDRTMVEACNVAAPRIDLKKPRRQAYWWQQSVAILRRNCLRTRRFWQRAKRRRCPQEIIDELGASYKLMRKDLRTEISRLKSKAWQELIGTIDEDPWGLPYRMVLRKLKLASPSLSELLDQEILAELLDNLFPRYDMPDPIKDWSNFV